MRWEKAWERNGTRRPFPSLWEAVEAYGRENVYFDKPQYVEDGICLWCGKPVVGKQRVYCTNECRIIFEKMTVWNRGRSAYSLRICFRDNFTCQDCGEFHAFENEHGIRVPIDDGMLDVHHIVPVSMGGGDEQQNLITLCKSCHKQRHRFTSANLEDGANPIEIDRVRKEDNNA